MSMFSHHKKPDISPGLGRVPAQRASGASGRFSGYATPIFADPTMTKAGAHRMPRSPHTAPGKGALLSVAEFHRHHGNVIRGMYGPQLGTIATLGLSRAARERAAEHKDDLRNTRVSLVTINALHLRRAVTAGACALGLAVVGHHEFFSHHSSPQPASQSGASQEGQLAPDNANAAAITADNSALRSLEFSVDSQHVSAVLPSGHVAGQ